MLLTSAIRDEGTSFHYLPANVEVVPHADITARYSAVLNAACIIHTSGATVTTDAPYCTTAEEICFHRANGARAV